MIGKKIAIFLVFYSVHASAYEAPEIANAKNQCIQVFDRAKYTDTLTSKSEGLIILSGVGSLAYLSNATRPFIVPILIGSTAINLAVEKYFLNKCIHRHLVKKIRANES